MIRAAPMLAVWAQNSETARGQAGAAALVFLPLLVLGLVVDAVLLARGGTRLARWSIRSNRLVRRPWTTADALKLGIALPVVFFVTEPLLRGAGAVPALLIQSAILYSLVLGYVARVLRRRSGGSLRRAFGMRWETAGRDIGAGLVAYLAAFPLVILFALAGQLLLRAAGFPVDAQPVLALFVEEQPWFFRLFLLAIAVVLAPVTEEVLFRGVGQVVIGRRLGMPVGIFVVSAVFALLHGHAPTFAPLLVVGAALSLAYIHTGSLTTAITMHVVFNSVNLAVLNLSG